MLAGAPATAFALPPIARLDAASSEAFVEDAVSFSAGRSIDPDGDVLTYEWTFGDGELGSGAETTHRFARRGVFQVTLTVSDGSSRSLATMQMFVIDRPSTMTAAHSGAMARSSDSRRLGVVSSDTGRFVLLSTAPLAVEREIAACARPVSTAMHPAGERAWVACADGEVLSIDARTGTVTARTSVGLDARAISFHTATERLVVTTASRPAAVSLDPTTLAERARIPLGSDPDAIAIVPNGAYALVSHFITRGSVGAVSAIDLDGSRVARIVELAEDPGPDGPSSGRGFPNLLGTVVVEPNGHGAWIGGLKSNTSRGTYLDGRPLNPHNRVRGVMLRVGLDDRGAPLDEVLRDRIDTNNADRVSAIAYSGSGRYAWITHPGIGAVSVVDLLLAGAQSRTDGAPLTPVERIDVGSIPIAVATSNDGARAWVLCDGNHEVVELDASALGSTVITSRVVVARDGSSPEIARGRVLFSSSRAPIHSEDGYIACASCHPGGGSDGRTWDFTSGGEGLRNTIDLRGRGGLLDGPLHWSANFDEVQDFENDIVHAFGGTGLAGDGRAPNAPLGEPNRGRSRDLDALAAYVSSLDDVPRSPSREGDRLSAAAARGRTLFFSAETRCASCHQPPRFTDSIITADPRDFVLHDVGTIGPSTGRRLGGELRGLDTPSLLGVWATAPYLHDGRAATLREVLAVHNAEDRHGRTSHLSSSEVDDLVAYVESIDGRPDLVAGNITDGGVEARDAAGTTPPFPRSAGCGVASLPPPGSRAALFVIALVVLVSIRKRRSP